MIVGILIGLLLAAALVFAVILPPAELQRWIMHPEPLAVRIERGLNPTQQYLNLKLREREFNEALARKDAEISDLKQKLAASEVALSAVRDQGRTASVSTIQGIRIKERTGSSYAMGAIYIGVQSSIWSAAFCVVNASSDKVDGVQKNLHVGQSMQIASSRAKYRLVLTSLDRESCVFDLLKD